MFAFLRILLLSVHLLHFKTTLAEDVPSIRPTTTTTTTLSDQILHTKAVESLAASNATFERDFNAHEDGE